MEEVAVQARTHHAIGRQWKSRSVLLLPNFSRDKPLAVAPGPVIQHEGAVMQLSGKGLLVPGSWKRRYCVLDGRRLYYYQLNGENQGHRHYRDKTSHYVDLDSYDICEEAKGIKTASNVLVISSSEIEKSFFDTGRLYLSAETGKEMNEWISQIRSAMTALRDGQKSQPARKSQPSADVSTTCATDTKANEQIPLEASISLMNSGEHLDCITKQRAKGPTGRRLPRQAKSRLYPTDAVQQQRSESLPRLELQAAGTDAASNIRSSQPARGRVSQHNRSFDTGQQNKRAAAYAYSSSDDSLNMSFAQPTADQHEDDETVETLCEIPAIHHSSSTPSLVCHPSFGQLAAHNHWMSVGSSSSTPRPVASGKRRSQPYSCGSTSADDPPDLPQQYQLLLQQTAAIRTTLSGLEADFGASRRDMGWLQENLTTVQSATGSVSDKVVKMQSQVANMERQINGAVKEAQQLQQRANEALKSASDAERDFRRLENDCQSLLTQLRQQQQSSDSLADPLSPMTPHPPGLMMMSFQQTGLTADTTSAGHHFSSQRPAAGKLPPLAPVPQLHIPPTFDFAALLTKPAPVGLPACELLAAPAKMKSSFRSEGVNKNGNKSISFGPTTTYATSPTTDPDDVALPAATSTLKTRKNVGPSFVLPTSDFNQNSPHSMMTS
ncbi:hypothetical protein GHT06_016542 [Daphnia sinensis]|uniref:PH domain-containing protein n=1 Tax=Daphnia sinensis TaxID=1820382 RepID=A0AAD5L630_9CRUS|nr:hypothetical protein GHT06_016542 [Daphnia sinensis]